MLGALSAALCEMAGNLTLGKKKYADVEPSIRLLIDKAETLRLRFLRLIDEDAAAFEPLSRAYAIPKSDPQYRDKLREATLAACEAPMDMMRCTCRAVELLEEMMAKCSRLLVSDVGCGAAIAGAALDAAALNVFVNTRLLPGELRARELEREAESMLLVYRARAQRLSDTVMNQLRGQDNG